MCSKTNLHRLVPVLEGGDSLQIQHLHSSGKAKNMITFYILTIVFIVKTEDYNPTPDTLTNLP